MKRALIGGAALCASLLGVLVVALPAGAQPGPSAGRLIAGGLLNPRGITVGPDDMRHAPAAAFAQESNEEASVR